MKDVHSWVEPLGVVALRIIELLHLPLKHGENAASRIAGFELVSERVDERILLGTFFVRLQSIIENELEVGGCGSRVSVRHEGEVSEEMKRGRIVGNGETEERHAS